MTEPKAFAERDLVLVAYAEKHRPGIVLRVDGDSAIVLMYGTGTPRDLPRVEVRPETREGKALGFYKPTYFYATTVVVVTDLSALTPKQKKCPPELYLKLRSLWQRGNA